MSLRLMDGYSIFERIAQFPRLSDANATSDAPAKIENGETTPKRLIASGAAFPIDSLLTVALLSKCARVPLVTTVSFGNLMIMVSMRLHLASTTESGADAGHPVAHETADGSSSNFYLALYRLNADIEAQVGPEV